MTQKCLKNIISMHKKDEDTNLTNKALLISKNTGAIRCKHLQKIKQKWSKHLKKFILQLSKTTHIQRGGQEHILMRKFEEISSLEQFRVTQYGIHCRKIIFMDVSTRKASPKA